MTGLWLFDRIADGLFLQGPRHLVKPQGRNVLLDINGAPLSNSGVDTATTWRSTHAFGGRCALGVDRNLGIHSDMNNACRSGGGDVPHPDTLLISSDATESQSPNDYSAWVVDFHLRSACEDPHVLLSVAPRYAPPRGNLVEAPASLNPPTANDQNIYDKRMLETPLIWEEPMTLSIDCTSSGMYIWSEAWAFFGEKMADKCFLRRSHRRGGDDDGNNLSELTVQDGSYEAFVRLKWHMFPVGKSGAQGGERPSSNSASSAIKAVGDMPFGKLAVFFRTSCPDPEEKGTSATGQFNGDQRAHGGERVSSGVQVWKCVGEIPLLQDEVPDGIQFTPYVTLMDGGDEVTLV